MFTALRHVCMNLHKKVSTLLHNCARVRSAEEVFPCQSSRQSSMLYAGLLFDCEEHGGPVAGNINLRAAEPMHMAALWSCIYDAMYCNKEISSILNPKAGAKVRLITPGRFSAVCLCCKHHADCSQHSSTSPQQGPLLHVPMRCFASCSLGHLPHSAPSNVCDTVLHAASEGSQGIWQNQNGRRQ